MARILFSLTYYHPYISGLSIYVERIAEALAREKNEVFVLTSCHEKKLPRQEVINNVKIERVPWLFKISKGFIMPVYFFSAWRQVGKVDCVFVNLPQVEGAIVSIIAALLKKKLIVIYHCDLVLPKGFFNWIINRLTLFFNDISLKLAKKIVVYTKEYAETSKFLRKYCSKFVEILPPVFPLSADGDFYQKLVKMKILGLKIGFAARVAEEKGLEFLIAAACQIPQAKIFIAGPKNEVVGERKYRARIDKLISQNKNRVYFLGSLTAKEMGAFYRFIDILVLPSVNRTESFGLVQAEAMFAGKPVVASNLPGVRFLINKTNAGRLANVNQVDDLKAQIMKIALNYQLYAQKTKKINEIVKFTNTVFSYKELIANG